MSESEKSQQASQADETTEALEQEAPEASAEDDQADLQAELSKARDEVNSAQEQVLRTQAEMQNLRRRMERDLENAHKYGVEKLVGELLPVVDDLERAIAAGKTDDEQSDTSALLEGVQLTLKNFSAVLTRFKVEPVDPHGQPFDPELHQAMSMVPNPDVEPNTVIEVFQKGYTLNGRLVRPAMVVVAKAT